MQIAVSDDWPDLVPISDAELRVIEGHLRSELDKLFGPLPWCKEYKAMTSAARQPHQDEAPVATTARAALYLRVSTSKQAESDLSIPDQRRQMENYCL